MLKRQAGKSAELPPPVNTEYLEHGYCENAREVYETLHPSSLNKFTYSRIDVVLDDLNGILYRLNQLPEAIFKELIQVIEGLSEARNELRHARFLYDVEEINSVHRLVMRNRAVRKGKQILQKVLLVWPLHSPS